MSHQGARGRLIAYYPGGQYPAVSVTGGVCQLGCDHCRGHYLQGMVPALTPERLIELAAELEGRGCSGMLISGGCDKDGTVPLSGYAQAIARIKRDTRLKVSVHPGLIDHEQAEALVSAGVDVFCVDIHQDPSTVRGILHLDIDIEAYKNTLEALSDSGAANVCPHLCIGLSPSDGPDRAAVDLISEFSVSSLSLLSFMPTCGTPMAGAPLASNERFIGLVEYAVQELDCPVNLGCMRPRGNVELEIACYHAGVRGIAVPSSGTVQRLVSQGVKVERRDLCCSFL